MSLANDGIPESGELLAEKYLVERVLGRGGMGTVFAVSHVVTGKRLALKCLLPRLSHDGANVERFMREARAVGRVQHRHVIDVFDVGRAGDTPFLVMPLLEGKPLDVLFDDDQLTLEQALVILIRAMEGVSAAHAQGIVHRDLKPSNIFVCVGIEGQLDDPRVLDFGISKLEEEQPSRLTKSGAAIGTPNYMALEQLTGRPDVDQRADVYAMGVILYEAISGKLPNVAENLAGLAIERMYGTAVHLRVLRPDLPSGLADVVMRALARDPEDRFATMQEFASELRAFVAVRGSLAQNKEPAVRLRTPREGETQAMPEGAARASAATERASANAFDSEQAWNERGHAESASASRTRVEARGSEREPSMEANSGAQHGALPLRSLAPRRRVLNAGAIALGLGLLAVLVGRLSDTPSKPEDRPQAARAVLGERDAGSETEPVRAPEAPALLGTHVTVRAGGDENEAQREQLDAAVQSAPSAASELRGSKSHPARKARSAKGSANVETDGLREQGKEAAPASPNIDPAPMPSPLQRRADDLSPEQF
jgi:serine/threonine protein kinase